MFLNFSNKFSNKFGIAYKMNLLFLVSVFISFFMGKICFLSIKKYTSIRIFLHILDGYSQMLREFQCEDRPMTISCPPGTLLSIFSANYGRTDSFICGNPSQNQATNTFCVNFEGQPMMKFLCDNKLTCTFEPNFIKHFFGDKCPETWKYLEIYYYCIKYSSPISNSSFSVTRKTSKYIQHTMTAFIFFLFALNNLC